MAWTAPMTAVAGQAFNAADFNLNVRDNLNETAPAKATTSGSFFVGNGANSIVERIPATELVDANESSASTTYTNLTTVGPTITIQTGARAFVSLTARSQNNTDSRVCYASLEISGATTLAASDDHCLQHDLADSSDTTRSGIGDIFVLNPGLNTFTVKYRVNNGIGSWRRRRLSIIPF